MAIFFSFKKFQARGVHTTQCTDRVDGAEGAARVDEEADAAGQDRDAEQQVHQLDGAVDQLEHHLTTLSVIPLVPRTKNS